MYNIAHEAAAVGEFQVDSASVVERTQAVKTRRRTQGLSSALVV